MSPGAKVTVPPAGAKSTPGSARPGGTTPDPTAATQSAVTSAGHGADNVTGIEATVEPASPSVSVTDPGTTRGRR